MLKFFHFHASCSLASHIALEEAGAEYLAVPVRRQSAPAGLQSLTSQDQEATAVERRARLR